MDEVVTLRLGLCQSVGNMKQSLANLCNEKHNLDFIRNNIKVEFKVNFFARQKLYIKNIKI